MCQQKFEVADVLSAVGNNVESLGLNTFQLRTLRAIKQCRTAALGGHVDACSSCGVLKISYNSCRNRHCPKCQGHKREQWIQKREAELLPVPYYHVVFTLPNELNPLAMHKTKLIYDALFAAAWQTIQQFAMQQGLQMGMISILHTWGQNLCLHPHLHCIVPGAGVAKHGKLKVVKGNGKFLFAVKGLSKMFRAKYVAALRNEKINDQQLFDALFKKNWVVYAKRPFGNASSVIEYLGRYTHKVAIGNSRLTQVSNSDTTFYYKDYKEGGTKKTMTLRNEEFIRRLALHILPHRFVRIRHYGILSSTWKRQKLQQLQAQNGITPKETKGTKLHCCPHCKTPTMITINVFGKRGPPAKYLLQTKINPANMYCTKR
jgi:hypothetical protein